MTLWESIDIFVGFVLTQFSINSTMNISFSYLMLTIYISIHIVGGILFGIIARKIPNWVEDFSHKIDFDKIIPEDTIEKKDGKRKKKFWYQKTSGIVFIILAIALIIISYTTPAFESNLPVKIITMFIRSIVITILWILLISPYAIKFLQKVLSKKKLEYTSEVENIVNLLPEIRAAIIYSWKESNKKNGLGRIKLFLSYIFVITLRE